MTNYINNIAVDLNIYDNWPEPIKNCCAVYVPPIDNDLHHLFIINEKDGFLAKNVIESYELPRIPEVLALINFRINENQEAPVQGLMVKENIRDSGVGKFLCILTRTWVAENLNAKIYSPENDRSIEVEKILIDIALEYNENSIKLATTDGEYKTIDQIEDLNTELGI